MNPAPRALFLLVAVLGAMVAPQAGAARVDGCTFEERGSEQDFGWPWFLLPGDLAPVLVEGPEKHGPGPGATGRRVERAPRPRPVERVLDPRRCGAFAAGERPEALAFLRVNGSANANGAGT